MENMELLDKKIPYSVKKLIAINSISYCYTELPIDRHCALFGRNNLGKTSLLNALKLHLFPEISFNECKSKFSFKSSKGELYSTEDSYSYYFPSDSSFLILEAENIHGPFCLILFKSNSSFGYQRLALPCEYDAIRSEFWDIHNTEVNNGLGSPVSDLGIPKIHALYRQYKTAGAELLTTKKDIKEKLFSHNPMQKTKGRYCLVPLKEGGMDRELSAFRQLMNFTFEIAKTDTKGLTETFATIIESGKINTQDKLHQDLQKILDEYNELRQTQDNLKAIGNFRDAFKQLNEVSQSLQNKELNFSRLFLAYRVFLEKNTIIIKTKKEEFEEKINKLIDERHRRKNIESTQINESSKFDGQLETLRTDINKLSKKLSRFQEIENEHQNNDIAKLQEHLIRIRDELNNDITNLNDRQAAIDALSAKINLKNSKTADRDAKENTIYQQDKLLINQLDQHSAKILSNLNAKFSSIIASPNSEQVTIIEEFGYLFNLNDSGMTFLGELFINAPLKSPQQCREEIQRQIGELNHEINYLEIEITKIQKQANVTGEFKNTQLREAQEKLVGVKSDLIVVNAIEDTHLQWLSKSSDIEHINNEQKILKEHLEETQNLLKQINDDLATTKEQADLLTKHQQDITSLSQRLEKLQPDTLRKVATQESNTVSASDLTELEGEQARIISLKEHVNNKINTFVQCGYFSLPITIAYNSYDYEQQTAILEALSNTFAALHDQQETLQSRIIEHNKMTGAKIGELTGNRGHIRAFINKVNKQFEDYNISNLKEIRVEIELDHRFEELVNELENTNLNTVDIHDDALYQRLNQFCEDFFIGMRGNRILEMSKIIKNVKYSYKKEHQDKREEKDQSTGTNALINCTLLTILMRDLLAQETTLKLPVIFDEFTALDEYNQRTAIKAATEHGFSLFCASPTVTAEVADVVDYYITLDDFHANTIYDTNGERDVVFHHFWERLYEMPEPQAL